MRNTPGNEEKHPLEQIAANEQCMGCGFCAATFSHPDPAISVTMCWNEEHGHHVPAVHGWHPGAEAGYFICPGHAMDMRELSRQVFGGQPDNPMSGHVVAARAVYAANEQMRRKAASGGAIPALLSYLFEHQRIDRAYVLSTTSGALTGKGRTIYSMREFESCHGSHYHPAEFGAGLADFLAGEGRFAFVGLPCEIAAMRQLLADAPRLAKECVALISLFCGGVNTFRGISYYLRGHGVQPGDVVDIAYRVGDWPGDIEIGCKNGQRKKIKRIHGSSRWQIMHYMAAFQGFWMLKRCRICPDQIGDFADIAVGDPHLPRFRKLSREHDGAGFSAMLTRTNKGEQLVRHALAQGYLLEVPMSVDEVIKSQGYTLQQRRLAEIYARVDRKLGGVPPDVTGYEGLLDQAGFRQRLIAFLDLSKLRLRLKRPWRPLIWAWQTFEYVFLRFSPAQVGRRLMNVLLNR